MTQNMQLAESLADRLANTLPESVSTADLVDSAYIGLIDAAEKYDPRRRVRFTTYAAQRIRGAMLDGLRRQDWVPRMIRTKSNALGRERTALAAELGREPTDEEMIARLGLTSKAYYKLLEEIDVKAQISIESSSSGGEGSDDVIGIHMLAEPKRAPILDTLQNHDLIMRMFRGLQLQERIVMKLYYLCGWTMREVGNLLGLSESRVCQVHEQAITFLREKAKQERFSG